MKQLLAQGTHLAYPLHESPERGPLEALPYSFQTDDIAFRHSQNHALMTFLLFLKLLFILHQLLLNKWAGHVLSCAFLGSM